MVEATNMLILTLAIGTLFFWKYMKCRSEPAAAFVVPKKLAQSPEERIPGVSQDLVRAFQRIVDRNAKPLDTPVTTPGVKTETLLGICTDILSRLNTLDDGEFVETSLVMIDSFLAKADAFGSVQYNIVFSIYDRISNTTIKIVADVVVRNTLQVLSVKPWSHKDTSAILGYEITPGYTEYRNVLDQPE